MRTTITIPDAFYKKIKASLEEKGFITINDYLLSLLRNADHQIDALPKIPIKTPFIPSPMNDLTPLSPLPPEEPSKYPSTLYGKPLSGRKQNCPICYENVPIEFAQTHFSKEHGDI